MKGCLAALLMFVGLILLFPGLCFMALGHGPGVAFNSFVGYGITFMALAVIVMVLWQGD